jgi:hypothetical protein
MERRLGDENVIFDREDYDTIFTILAVESVIAIVANLFIIVTYARFVELRKRSFEMVLILSIWTILSNTTYLLAPAHRPDEGQCVFQGFVLNLFGMGTIFWTTWIAWCLYCAVVLQKQSPSLLLMHSVTIGFSTFLSILPFFTDSYARVGAFCWISAKSDAGQAFRFICWYLPLWAAFLINLYLHNRVSKTLRNFATLSQISNGSLESQSPETKAATERLMRMADHLQWYPLIFVIAWLPNTVTRLAQAINPSLDDSFTFTVIHVSCHGVFYQSIGNVLAYGLNDSVKEKWGITYEAAQQRKSLKPFFHFEKTTQVSGENDLDEDYNAKEAAKKIENPAL